MCEKGFAFGDNCSHSVHEHLVRDRSEWFDQAVGLEKEDSGKDTVVDIHAFGGVIIKWVQWLYGQRITASEGKYEIYDLESIIDLYFLAQKYKDYECVNACLDAIREMFLELRKELFDLLYIPSLEDVLKLGCDVTGNMLADIVAYGPWADSKEQIKEWTESWDYCEETRRFGAKLRKAQKAKLAAETSGRFDKLPNFMAPHAYHLRKPGETLCCGRDKPKSETDSDEIVPTKTNKFCKKRSAE